MLMTWNLLLIEFGVQFTHLRAFGRTVETVALKEAVNPCIQGFDSMITIQIGPR